MRRSPIALAALLVATSFPFSRPVGAAPKRATGDDASEGTSVLPARRIAVERFKGPKDAQVVRGAVVSALEAEVTLNVTSVLLLDKHKKMNDGSPEGYSAIAERLDLVAILLGKVGKGQEGYIVAITVVGGKDGKSLGTLAFQASSLPELRKKLNLELFDALDPLLARAMGEPPKPEPAPEPEPAPTPAPAPEPEPAPEPIPEAKPEERKPKPKSKPEPAPAPDVPACPWLEVDARGGVSQRAFNFTGEESGALRGYGLRYAPYAAGRVTYRPWAHSTCGLPSGLGVRVGYEEIFGIQSTLAERSLDAFAFALQAELEFAFRFGLFSLTPRAGFRYRHFRLSGDFVPDPRYKLVATGLDGGLRAGMFLFELGGAGHFVLDAGSLQSDDWFPNATGFGWQAEARIGLGPTRWFDVFALGEYESYTFALHTEEPGRYPAGVAVGSYDRYLRFGLGVRFNVPSRAGAK